MSILSDSIISAILKKGVIFEGREVYVDVPIKSGTDELKIHISCDHVTIKLDKESH